MSSHSGKVGVGPVPPRWLNCPRKSATLVGMKFLAFKTPLSARFDDRVPPANRFSPAMLFGSMNSYKVKIGLWIDLTNTGRFYDRAEIEENGARYVKLNCRGHGECPTEDQVKTFVDICERFIRKQPLEVIGVHCTHGFNRTGFLIASYFILKDDWSCDLAYSEFCKARPPGIYKESYIQSLFARYGDANDTPAPPALPDWCYEGENSDDEDGGGSAESRGKKSWKRKREFNRRNATFMEGVSQVHNISEQPLLSDVQKRIQDMCGWTSAGFPGCQPVSMDMENINLLKTDPYYVSWKADGTRYMMLIDGKGEVYFADRDNSVFRAPNIEFRQKHNLKCHICDTLVDGEMVIDVDRRTNQKLPRYLIYDAIRIQGRDIISDPFPLRWERIYTDLIQPRHAAIVKGFIDKTKESFGIRRKDFWAATYENTEKLLSENFKRQLLHEPDGLIFQPRNDPYTPGQCKEVLKWKPASLNSVDFKLKIVKESGIGVLSKTVGELYVCGLSAPFGKIKYTKALKGLDNKIIECKFVGNQWEFMRERNDKSFPNAYETAQAVCASILNPVTEELLLRFIQDEIYYRSDREVMPPPSKRPKLS